MEPLQILELLHNLLVARAQDLVGSLSCRFVRAQDDDVIYLDVDDIAANMGLDLDAMTFRVCRENAKPPVAELLDRATQKCCLFLQNSLSQGLVLLERTALRYFVGHLDWREMKR